MAARVSVHLDGLFHGAESRSQFRTFMVEYAHADKRSGQVRRCRLRFRELRFELRADTTKLAFLVGVLTEEARIAVRAEG
jgi:hypothetical protein